MSAPAAPQCAAAVAEAAQAWLMPAVLQPLAKGLEAHRGQTVSEKVAGQLGGSYPAAATMLGALAAVLHYLAAYATAVEMQRGDLRALRAVLAASQLLPSTGPFSERAGGNARHPILAYAVGALSIATHAGAAVPGTELLDAALALQRALQVHGHAADDSCLAMAIAEAVTPQVRHCCGVEKRGGTPRRS